MKDWPYKVEAQVNGVKRTFGRFRTLKDAIKFKETIS